MINPRVRIIVPAALASLLALTALPAAGASPARAALGNINHIVVIYQENHSFDNLYGGWERVNGLNRASSANTIQITQGGVPYACLKQNDVNLATPPRPATCADMTTGKAFSSNFPNQPFNIDDYIASTDTTCPAPGFGFLYPNGVAKGSGLSGGCTEDLVHRYYQEQYQLNGGLQNRYVTGSDAIGLTMGVYKTQQLPIYQYLHRAGHPPYAIADKFFQGAFGGSFLNHQWLVAAAAPIFAGAANDASPIVASNPHPDMHSVVDANGMPNNYPLYTSLLGPNGSSMDPTKNPTGPRDNQLTASCSPPAGRPVTPSGVVCGDFAVNTTQPWYQPYAPGTKDGRRLPPLAVTPGSNVNVTIGDELSANGVDWAWYAGGWSNADGRVGDPGWSSSNGPTACNPAITAASATYPFCPDKLFQFHHQAFNYYQSYGRVGNTANGAEKPARVQHLRDEQEFLNLASQSTAQCQLKPVSFVKPIGAENEHPGYTGESAGSSHLVELITAIERSACKNDTLIVSTYDEFGGQWDHVSPPGQGGSDGVADQWGPGTRIPALVISPNLNGDFVVDHVPHDTTSILATIEHRFGLAPLGTRDAAVRDLSSVYNAR